MNILMTANATWTVWNFRRPLVEALLLDGHKITVVAPADDSAEQLESVGCRIINLEMNIKGLNPFGNMNLQYRLGRIFRLERPDIVLSFTIKNNIFGARAAKQHGVVFVPNVTGLGTAFLSGKLLQSLAEHLYRCSFKGIPVVFFQNEDDQSLFLRRRLVVPDQARLLPGSGIDLQRFSPMSMPTGGEPPVFLMIARMLRDKGVFEFVEAARMIKRHRPEVRFQLLGSIGYENRTAIDRETVEAWVETGVVEYLGTTKDVRPIISAATCVVLPSYREGAPRTLIEAAALGRPVIATDVPGCRAVVDRDVSGFLCDVRSAESLRSSIERFLKLDAEEMRAMGAAGRRKMEREFDQAIVVSAYRDVLSQFGKVR